MSSLKTDGDTLSVDEEPDDEGRDESPALFVVFRCDDALAAPCRFALAGVDEVLLGRGEGAPRVESGRLHLSLRDPRMSLSHARLQRRGAGFVLCDLKSKNGTLVNGAAIDELFVADGDVIELGGTFLVYRCLHGADDGGPVKFLGVETLLPQLARELGAADALARSLLPLLLLGETGTGKEVVARAAHAASGRAGPVVAVKCAALPAALVESELFGTKKGAFSGADADRGGLIFAAHKGTLFLDEVGELPLAAQAALLRVLQDGEVTPLGATKPIPCDVRIISATNRNLSALVDAGRFRADLYARLSGFKLHLWALRDRKEDLGLLIASLLRRLAPERAPAATFSIAAARCLFDHDWPRNIRELEKALAAALVLSEKRIERSHLQLAPSTKPSPADPGHAIPRSAEHDERRQLLGEL